MFDYGTLSVTVWVIFLGICFGAFYAYYYRRLLGDLLRAFISAGAENEQTAKTLDEIGYGSGIKRRFAEMSLKKGSGLRRTIEAVYEETDRGALKKDEDELFVKAPKPDHVQRYYISEEKRYAAEVRYDGEGTTTTTVLVTVGVFFAVAIIVISLLPWIINNSAKIFGGGKGDSDGRYENGTDDEYSAEADTENEALQTE